MAEASGVEMLAAVRLAGGLVVQRGRLDRAGFDALVGEVISGEVDAGLVLEALSALCWQFAVTAAEGDMDAAAAAVLGVAQGARVAGDGGDG